MTYRILAINPGSTSTKFAVYDGENQILSKTLNHSVEELSKFNCIMDQFEMRKNEIENTLKENMIVTDEPGIYIPNQFGVRIEDTVLVNRGMSTSLTKSEKDYVIVDA